MQPPNEPLPSNGSAVADLSKSSPAQSPWNAQSENSFASEAGQTQFQQNWQHIEQGNKLSKQSVRDDSLLARGVDPTEDASPYALERVSNPHDTNAETRSNKTPTQTNHAASHSSSPDTNRTSFQQHLAYQAASLRETHGDATTDIRFSTKSSSVPRSRYSTNPEIVPERFPSAHRNTHSNASQISQDSHGTFHTARGDHSSRPTSRLRKQDLESEIPEARGVSETQLDDTPTQILPFQQQQRSLSTADAGKSYLTFLLQQIS